MPSRAFQPRIVTFARRPADELLLRTGRGDARAFEELYYRLLPAVVAFVRSRVSPAAPLDDLLQEVFARVWGRRRSFEGRSSAKTYVLGVALNVIRQYRQQGGAELIALERMELPDTRSERCEDELERREQLRLLKRARLALTEAQSTAITLVYDEQMTPPEAAEILGCTEKALRLRLERGRQKLRVFLTANPSARKRRTAGKSSEEVS